MGIEAVFVCHIRRQHLIFAFGRQVFDDLLRLGDFDTLFKSGAEPDHVHGNIEYDFCLVTVSGTAVDFGALLPVAAEKQKRYRCGKFGFSVFLGNFNVCGVELPIPVRFECSEHIPDDLFLPVHQFKRLSCPCAFRMTERLDKGYGIVGGWLIVVRAFCHECRRFIFFQLSHGNRLLSAGIKIRPDAVFPV